MNDPIPPELLLTAEAMDCYIRQQLKKGEDNEVPDASPRV